MQRVARAFAHLRPRDRRKRQDDCGSGYALCNGQSSSSLSGSLFPRDGAARVLRVSSAARYLRVWLDGGIVRQMRDKKTSSGARVQVIQDRLTISEERARASSNRLRPRSGSQRPNQRGVDRKSASASAIRTQTTPSPRLALRALRSRYPAATPGLFSFNNHVRRMPACRGFGRRCDRFQPGHSDRALSIARPVRVFRGEEWVNRKKTYSAPAPERRSTFVCLRGMPKYDRISSSTARTARRIQREDYESDRWYGVRGFFKWLESDLQNARARFAQAATAPTHCPFATGALSNGDVDYRLLTGDKSRFPAEFAALPITQAREFLTSLALSPTTPRRPCCEARLSRACVTFARSGSASHPRSLDPNLSGRECNGQPYDLSRRLALNTLFVMDEPSVGLHPRDVGRLVRVMQNCGQGNTLLVSSMKSDQSRADHCSIYWPAAVRVVASWLPRSARSFLGSDAPRVSVSAPRRNPLRIGKVRDGEGAIAGTRGAAPPVPYTRLSHGGKSIRSRRHPNSPRRSRSKGR